MPIGIKKTQTTPGLSQGKGQMEWLKCTLINLLRVFTANCCDQQSATAHLRSSARSWHFSSSGLQRSFEMLMQSVYFVQGRTCHTNRTCIKPSKVSYSSRPFDVEAYSHSLTRKSNETRTNRYNALLKYCSPKNI